MRPQTLAAGCHKWPRGLKKKLMELDGGDRCFFCWSHQGPMHIAHVDDYKVNGTHSFPYEENNRYDPRFLVLLCNSCHSKLDSTWYRDSPWHRALMTAYRARRARLEEKVKE